MNLVLVFSEDFAGESRVVLRGRRADHVREVHRAAIGDELVVGVAGGRIGRGRVLRVGDEVEMEVAFDRDPPPSLDITLVLALPRPKVLNRIIAAITSLGIKRLFLINAWRVEKSYWKSPRMSDENLRAQAEIGLEQARDTMLPVIETRRLFRPFVEKELPSIIAGTTALLAHPYATEPCPRDVRGGITLAVGPEGGFIEKEIASLTEIGFRPVTIGERILRVETAVATLIGSLGRGPTVAVVTSGGINMDQNSPQQGSTSPTAIPQTSTESSGSVLGDLLRTLGVGQSHADEVHKQASGADVNKQIDQTHKYVTDALQQAREQAAKNPGLVLGGLSALVIAAGMLRGRR